MAQAPRKRKKTGKTALFLAGGAPNMTLTSGALLALHEHWVNPDEGRQFDIVSMAGAGSVIGLMYLSPLGMTKEQALHATKDFGVSDLIYSMCPINYKVFGKSGPSADLFNDYWFNLPEVQAAMRQTGMTPAQKLYCDSLLFQGAMACPTDVSYFSQGFCGHPRLIDTLIDFPALRSMPSPYIEVNAFRLDGPEEDRGPCDFKKGEMTPHHLRAALSFPFIYPPYEINGLHYYEGAAFQVINPIDLKNANMSIANIETFIILNPMKREFIQIPRNLWDAYAQSIMMPVTAIAEFATGEIQRNLKSKIQRKRIPISLKDLEDQNVDIPLLLLPYFEEAKDKWFPAKFEVPSWHLPNVFDWTRSNLEILFDCGYEAGRQLAADLPW